MIAIVDYGAGNLRSVAKAFESLGHSVRITSRRTDILSAPAVVLPGVGSAGNAMRHLAELDLVDALREAATGGVPFFGVCLGMQVLFEGSEEGGWQECLGVLPGAVRRFPLGLKVPHMGWNTVHFERSLPIFDGVPNDSYFYFVHSYYAQPRATSDAVGLTEYSVRFCSAVAKGNLVATQFHPEKSGTLGLRLYDNFAKLAGL